MEKTSKSGSSRRDEILTGLAVGGWTLGEMKEFVQEERNKGVNQDGVLLQALYRHIARQGGRNWISTEINRQIN